MTAIETVSGDTAAAPAGALDVTAASRGDALVSEDETLVEEELLVEELSIDGMCGVY